MKQNPIHTDMKQPLKILVVDDDAFVRMMLKDILEINGYLVEFAENGAVALEKCLSISDLSLIISDMNMPVMDGLILVKELRKKDIDTPFVILTVNTQIQIALEAIRSGANDYLIKDENIEDAVVIAVKRAIEKYRLEKQNRQLLEDLALKSEELEKSNKELIELNQQKNRFLGIAAHDLRNPISGIIGISRLLIEELYGKFSESQMKKVSLILSTSNAMMSLLNDLLDISIIESGKLDLQKEKGSLRKLIIDRIRIQKVIADNKMISLHVDLSEIPDIVFDPKRIVQVFDNLMSNAIKFSPKNSDIYITLNQVNGMVKLSVADEGPGIPEQDISKLFDEFQKLTPKPTGDETSTGLGLAIVKKIIDAHQGVIEVQSKLGSGSTFSFKLPVDQSLSRGV